MIRRSLAGAALVVALLAAGPMAAAPTVYPTGTTIYQPDKTWNGYTVISVLGTRAVIVHRHERPGGEALGRIQRLGRRSGARVAGRLCDRADRGLSAPSRDRPRWWREDFAGKELWRFDHAEQIALDDRAAVERAPAS